MLSYHLWKVMFLESYSPSNLSLSWAIFPLNLNSEVLHLEGCIPLQTHREIPSPCGFATNHKAPTENSAQTGQRPTIIIQPTLPYTGTSLGGVVNTRDTLHTQPTASYTIVLIFFLEASRSALSYSIHIIYIMHIKQRSGSLRQPPAQRDSRSSE